MIDITLLTLKEMYKSKKTYILGIFLLLPLILGLYAVHKGENGTEVFSDGIHHLYLQLFLALVTLLFAITVFSDDIKSGRIAFLTTRVSRVRIVVEKYLGYVISTSVVFLIALTVMFITLSVYAPETIPLKVFFSYALVIILAIIAYGGFYFFISTLISKPLMFGLFFAFIWEISAPAISQRLAESTISHYLLSVAYELVEYGDIQNMSAPTSLTHSIGILCVFSVVSLGVSTILFKQKSLE
ncbi:MAG: ABC transporter permease subunit [Euryarchaeota archaeon]|nr:ABC transporter permease subunit [Euryarchaeota archaeon]